MDIKMNRQSAAKLDIILKPFPIDLDGYETKYKVSNDGRIWSEYLQDFMKPCYSKGGYLRVKVNFGERNKKFMVHRLVALAFIENENPEIFTQVDHIDCNRTNNCVENLRWVTPKQNTQHSLKLGNRDWYKYRFINSETGEVLEFSNAAKVCKYFGRSYQCGTIIKHANTGIPVRQGVFAGWIIERELVKKVQRLSTAVEQGQASRNGNNPTDEMMSRVLIQSDLYRNIELSQIKYIRPAERDGYGLAPHTEHNGCYQCRSVRADQPCKRTLLH